MPSATALKIALRARSFLGRELTRPEMLQCEELALNFYPKHVIEYIARLERRKAPPLFAMILHGIECAMRHLARRNDLIRMKGRMVKVYERVGSFVGDGFSETELAAIVFLSDDCSDSEIDACITYARGRGIHNAAYLKAVILGNRKRYTLGAIRRGRLSQYIPDLAELKELDVGLKNVPRVDRLRELWRFRVNKTQEKIKLVEAELNARKRIKYGRDTGDKREVAS